MKTVSIIMPVYNEEKTILNAVNSILEQTFRDFELIVVNDGSTDNTLQLLNNVKDERLVIVNKENGGVSTARNSGLHVAIGNYILFVDADDSVSIDVVEELINHANKSKDRRLIIFQSLIHYPKKVREKNPFKQYQGKHKTNDLIGELIENEILNSPWGKLFLHEPIKENSIRFNEDLLIAEDLVFNVDYLRYSDYIEFVNVGYYHYFPGIEGSLTSSLSREKYESLKLSTRILSEFIYSTFNLRNEISYLEFKNDLAYLQHLKNKKDFFKRHLSYMSKKEYIFKKTGLIKVVHSVVKTNNFPLNYVAQIIRGILFK